ncbi:MAG: hypothetical protein N2260_04635 [Syntrophobacterales bacterium]|nr:hypothetical protein [Syntrophobacterales bacterium]
MATIIPESEAIKKAIKWISAMIEEQGKQHLNRFINEAIHKFDLSPKDSEFLIGFYKEKGREVKCSQ